MHRQHLHGKRLGTPWSIISHIIVPFFRLNCQQSFVDTRLFITNYSLEYKKWWAFQTLTTDFCARVRKPHASGFDAALNSGGLGLTSISMSATFAQPIVNNLLIGRGEYDCGSEREDSD